MMRRPNIFGVSNVLQIISSKEKKMSKRIFNKIPLLFLQKRFRTSPILLQSLRYNLNSTYTLQNKINNKLCSSDDNNNISFDDLQKLLHEKNERKQVNAYIIDVREPIELIDGYIPGAINIPLNGFEKGKIMLSFNEKELVFIKLFK